MAGLRTNALVVSGAAMFVMMGGLIACDGSQGRIAAYVMSGIGLLGGGVILKDGMTNTRPQHCRDTLVHGCDRNIFRVGHCALQPGRNSGNHRRKHPAAAVHRRNGVNPRVSLCTNCVRIQRFHSTRVTSELKADSPICWKR
jgi:hypothetical protein